MTEADKQIWTFHGPPFLFTSLLFCLPYTSLRRSNSKVKFCKYPANWELLEAEVSQLTGDDGVTGCEEFLEDNWGLFFIQNR